MLISLPCLTFPLITKPLLLIFLLNLFISSYLTTSAGNAPNISCHVVVVVYVEWSYKTISKSIAYSD